MQAVSPSSRRQRPTPSRGRSWPGHPLPRPLSQPDAGGVPALLVSVGAQLMVPQLVQRILDAITRGVTAQQLAQVPTAFQPKALQALGWTRAVCALQYGC